MTLTILIASCGQNDIKQKELELKERELAVKQKELEQKEKDLQTNKDSSITLTTKPTEDKPDETLIISPIKNGGDLGQVTFTQKEKTIFFFDRKLKKGKIILNNKEYSLSRETLNRDNGTYRLIGNEVNITTSPCKWSEDEGGDCGYGKFSSVKIKLGTATLDLKNVEVQDCPDLDL